MWWKKNKWKIVVPVLIVAVLAGAFWYGGSAPGLRGWKIDKAASDTPAPPDKGPGETNLPTLTEGVSADSNGSLPADNPGKTPDSGAEPTPELKPKGEGIESRPGGSKGGMSAQEKLDMAKELAEGSSAGLMSGSEKYSSEHGMVIDPKTGKDRYLTDPVPEGKPVPVEPQDVQIGTAAYTCTISISCSTINDNISWLDPEKVELVPEDGWILPATTVTFYEGESVFNVLLRTCKQFGIHMEFMNTPIYNSAYIEGIHNLYEFDCGELSGWMYKVNEWFPNYGCSRYQLKEGDVICWVYTCNLGIDVGGYYAAGGNYSAGGE